MTTAGASVHLRVDPTNPGQFFACCGLLELANRLSGGAEGWFDDDRFCLVGVDGIRPMLAALTAEPAREITELGGGRSIKPLVAPLVISLGAAVSPLTLDAWMKVRAKKGEIAATGNPPWNFWSGQQTPPRIWRSLRAALLDQMKLLTPEKEAELFSLRVPLSGRFGFDPGAAWNALDVGFSPNEQGMDVASSPAVELLSAVGVQRFRPEPSGDASSFVYATWGVPLAVEVAAAAASGAVSVSRARRFRGRVVSRGSYAALAYSTPLEGGDDE